MMISKELFSIIGLPEQHREASIEKIPDTLPWKEVLIKYVDELPQMVKSGTGLLLYGKYGAGKSAAAAAIVMQALARNIRCHWVRSNEIAGIFYGNEEWNTRQSLRERVEEVPLLVIDELNFDSKDRRQLAMTDLARIRVDNGLPTLFTMNYMVDEAKQAAPAFTAGVKGCTLPVPFYWQDGKEYKSYNWRSQQIVKVEESLGVKEETPF